MVKQRVAYLNCDVADDLSDIAIQPNAKKGQTVVVIVVDDTAANAKFDADTKKGVKTTQQDWRAAIGAQALDLLRTSLTPKALRQNAVAQAQAAAALDLEDNVPPIAAAK